MASLVESLAAAIPQEALCLATSSEKSEIAATISNCCSTRGRDGYGRARRVVLAVRLACSRTGAIYAGAARRRSGGDERDADVDGRSGQGRVGFSGPPAGAKRDIPATLRGSRTAVLGEIFDACDASGATAALGGFFALSAQMREAFRDGLPMLVESQFVQLFGKALESANTNAGLGERKFTCAQADLDSSGEHPTMARTRCANPMDGKLISARRKQRAKAAAISKSDQRRIRIRDQLFKRKRFHDSAGSGVARFRQPEISRTLREWVASRQAPTFASYRKGSTTRSPMPEEQLTQRAMLGAMERCSPTRWPFSRTAVQP